MQAMGIENVNPQSSNTLQIPSDDAGEHAVTQPMCKAEGLSSPASSQHGQTKDEGKVSLQVVKELFTGSRRAPQVGSNKRYTELGITSKLVQGADM